MELEDEETNFEFERINYSSSNFTSILIRMDNTTVMHKINRQEPLHDNQKNMVFDRPKQDDSKSSSYSREIKYDDGQTESLEILSPTKNLSIHPKNIEMLSQNGYVRIEKKPIIEEIYINNTNQKPKQHRECAMNRLAKNRIPHIIISPNSSDSEDYTEVRQRRVESYSDCTEMEGLSMVNFGGGVHNVSNNSKKRRKHSDSRKEYGEKKHVPSTWQFRSSIINEYFEYEMNKIGGQVFIGGKPIQKPLFLEMKTFKDLRDIPQKWMLILEILTKNMGLRKLDVFIASLAESTQCSYKGGWSHFISFFIEENEPFPDWEDEDECIMIFRDFITWAVDNIKLLEVNIACSAISKMFQCLLPRLAIAKIQQIISLKKGVLMSHPKQIKYLKIWDLNLILSYYINIYTPTFDSAVRYNFLQKKVAIFLGFFFMLKP
jgi:hypothetical protein